MFARLWLRAGGIVVSVAALILMMTACSNATQSVTGGNGNPDSKGTVTIGVVPFDEVIAASNLWKNILEKQGYTVHLQQLEVATVYQGLSSGAVDVYMGATPLTHKDYWDRFSKDFVTSGEWYDTLVQGLAVPTYTGLKTVCDLQGKAAEFNGQIVGIEAGSGLMRASVEDVPKVYDMTGFTVVEGSTPAMLAALDKAINAKAPIVVTLWQPHWAFSRYDLTMLEDDKGAYPPSDVFNVIVSKKFSENTAVTDQFKRFHMDPDQLQSLELAITEAGTGNEQQAVQQWIDENQAAVQKWTGDRAS